MKIVIAGGTGFLGRPLAQALAGDGHDIVILTRQPPRGGEPLRTVRWTPDGTAGSWAAEIDGADVVVNLAGESIAKRWTASQKRRILDSRVLATRSVAQAIARSTRAPSVFVSGSAVGYYGLLGDEMVSEEHPPGTDFLARVCEQWEAATGAASAAGTRTVLIRTGLVLEKDGGALPKMIPPFWFGLGGPIGSGRQYWPWIHRTDWIALVRWTIAWPHATGPFNATAPTPVTSAAFARAIGRIMRRPAFMPTPAFVLKFALGEMAEALLLSGQRAVPAKAEHLGFEFTFTQLDDALNAIFQ